MEKTPVQSTTKIRRPLGPRNGRSSHLDPTVQSVLRELADLLGRRVLHEHIAKGGGRGGAAAAGAGAVAAAAGWDDIYEKKLTPLRGGSKAGWADDSLASELHKLPEKAEYKTLAEKIDVDADLAKLKYSFRDYQARKPAISDSTIDEILQFYPELLDYLVVRGYARQIRDARALATFVYEHPLGGKVLVDYATISATRKLVDDQQLKVENYNQDEGQFAKHLLRASIPLSDTSFQKSATASIQDYLFNKDEGEVIDSSSIAAKVTPALRPVLIKSMQKFPVAISKANADTYLPGIFSQLLKTRGLVEADSEASEVDEDFNVQFRDEPDPTVSDISRPAVRCAAQLYHAMVLDQELDVLGAMDRFVQGHLLPRNMEITDSKLRADLQHYVFSNRFLDLQSKERTDRTRRAEREMFYRQVFNQGKGELTEDMAANEDITRAWNVLILECGKYLQRANASTNPSVLSRQQVMQAIEDLQYNLSCACTGMVSVIAPLIDAELNFVLTRILKHKAVGRTVLPSGGSWKRVVDKLNEKRGLGRADILFNKAALGKDIIRAIADYDRAAFEEDAKFYEFLSLVDAYIITQSDLQHAQRKQREEEDEEEDANHAPVSDKEPRAPDSSDESSSEWDF